MMYAHAQNMWYDIYKSKKMYTVHYNHSQEGIYYYMLCLFLDIKFIHM